MGVSRLDWIENPPAALSGTACPTAVHAPATVLHKKFSVSIPAIKSPTPTVTAAAAGVRPFWTEVYLLTHSRHKVLN